MGYEPYRLTVEQYQRMVGAGILTGNDHCELLEGLLVASGRRSPAHEYSRHALWEWCIRLSDDLGWLVRTRGGVTLADSQPEPDVAIVRGEPRGYTTRHPGPSDFGVTAEVADMTLEFDRTFRQRVYARAAIPAY